MGLYQAGDKKGRIQLVSIVVPVYKVERFLRPCVDSILSQTYRDIQLILVDDGSPDGCGAICDEYAEKDNRVLALHKLNGGVSCARNFGLQYVRGEYVTFCDSDDMYAPDWIEQLVEAAAAHQADIVLGSYTVVDESGNVTFYQHHETGVYNITTPKEKVEYCFRKVMREPHGGEIWDRLFCSRLILDNHIRFCETCSNFAEDLGFVLCCALYTNRIVSMETHGYQYRIRSGSMMQNSISMARLTPAQEIYDYFAQSARTVFSESFAQTVLPWFYLHLIAGQFLPRVWNSGKDPDVLRKETIEQVVDWDGMKARLEAVLRKNWGWNPCCSGSENAEVICHIRYLLYGSRVMLRLSCKCIRVFRPILDRLGKNTGGWPVV